MNIIEYPSKEQLLSILKRPALDVSKLFGVVQDVINSVCERGDEALKELEERFDHVKLSSLKVSEEEFKLAESMVDDEMKSAIRLAFENIACFHKAQRFEPIRIETCSGVVRTKRRCRIERVGRLCARRTAPLFSTVLMLATPARIAGCKDIVLCTPPQSDGSVNPVIVFFSKVGWRKQGI
jgi:Histidinol dehydrogenase